MFGDFFPQTFLWLGHVRHNLQYSTSRLAFLVENFQEGLAKTCAHLLQSLRKAGQHYAEPKWKENSLELAK